MLIFCQRDPCLSQIPDIPRIFMYILIFVDLLLILINYVDC